MRWWQCCSRFNLFLSNCWRSDWHGFGRFHRFGLEFLRGRHSRRRLFRLFEPTAIQPGESLYGDFGAGKWLRNQVAPTAGCRFRARIEVTVARDKNDRSAPIACGLENLRTHLET